MSKLTQYSHLSLRAEREILVPTCAAGAAASGKQPDPSPRVDHSSHCRVNRRTTVQTVLMLPNTENRAQQQNREHSERDGPVLPIFLS